MNEKNLALVFGPNLARPKEIVADSSMMYSVSAINLFTESFLIHQQELFQWFFRVYLGVSGWTVRIEKNRNSASVEVFGRIFGLLRLWSLTQLATLPIKYPYRTKLPFGWWYWPKHYRKVTDCIKYTWMWNKSILFRTTKTISHVPLHDSFFGNVMTCFIMHFSSEKKMRKLRFLYIV